MTRKPIGKYDDLTPDERESLRIRTFIQTMVWFAVVFGLWHAEDFLGPFPRWLSTLLELLTLAAMLRVVWLTIRSIAIMSPNPKRREEAEQEKGKGS